MRVTDHLTAAFSICRLSNEDILKAWIAHSFKLGEVAGPGHLMNAQQNGELDLLIRQMDKEAKPPSDGGIDIALNIRFSLSNCWVLRAYEMVRAANEQLRLKDQSDERITRLNSRLGLVRMPTAKAQIQGKKSELSGIVLAHADGSDPKGYRNEGTYIAPSVVCSITGSVGWRPVDAVARESVYIRRIDLSNELLGLFD